MHGVNSGVGGTMHNAQRLLSHGVVRCMMIIHGADYAEDLVSIGDIWSLKRNMKPPHSIARRNLIRRMSPSACSWRSIQSATRRPPSSFILAEWQGT